MTPLDNAIQALEAEIKAAVGNPLLDTYTATLVSMVATLKAMRGVTA